MRHLQAEEGKVSCTRIASKTHHQLARTHILIADDKTDATAISLVFFVDGAAGSPIVCLATSSRNEGPTH